jgi:very-short-patch-repair endonuclease
VARWQLLAAGVSDRAIFRRRRSGHLIDAHSGVYVVGHMAEIPLGDETAALLACSRPASLSTGQTALLSHHSAATLWRLRPGRARPVHVTVTYTRQTGRPDGVLVHRSRILRARDARMHERLPVTSPARTLLDIATGLPVRDVELALQEGRARRIVRDAHITEILRRAGRHPGRPVLAAVMGVTGSLTETQAEELLYTLVHRAQLPLPRAQYDVLGYRADFAWPELRLIVEVDDLASHATRTGLSRDRRRDVTLANAGWTVLRFTNVQIELEPDAVLAQVAHAVLARATAAASATG